MDTIRTELARSLGYAVGLVALQKAQHHHLNPKDFLFVLAPSKTGFIQTNIDRKNAPRALHEIAAYSTVLPNISKRELVTACMTGQTHRLQSSGLGDSDIAITKDADLSVFKILSYALFAIHDLLQEPEFDAAVNQLESIYRKEGGYIILKRGDHLAERTAILRALHDAKREVMHWRRFNGYPALLHNRRFA